jgi:hypothetical protein
MIARLVLVAAILAGVVSGRMASTSPAAQAARGCAGVVRALEAAGPSSPISLGRGLAAVQRDGVAMVTPAGEGRAFRHPGSQGLLRHAASRPGVGTAYVNDMAGSDVMVVLRPGGVATIEGRGELTHPAWSPSGELAWAVDLSAIEVWSPGTGARRLVPPPRGAAGIFSPVFTAPGKMVAIIQRAVGGTHDDALNDLWRYDFGARTWSRLTGFRADLDRWSVLRTPVVTPDSSLFFVRVAGRAWATRLPSFELWVLREGRASKVRDLSGEMYLAGWLGGRLVWNVADPATGDWRLVMEGPGGGRTLGCGAVSVDPVTEPDPDLMEAHGEPEASPDPGSGAHPDLGESKEGLALLVGDFNSAPEARALAEDLRVRGALVVDHQAAPMAIRPGAWAVVVPVPRGSLPERALADLRTGRPGLADRTWIVPFQVELGG